MPSAPVNLCGLAEHTAGLLLGSVKWQIRQCYLQSTFYIQWMIIYYTGLFTARGHFHENRENGL